MSNKVYDIITEKIMKELEKGTVPWQKTWTTEGPRNAISNRPYTGINVFLLQMMGKTSQYWLTFRQVKEIGGSVKPGAESEMVVFWKVRSEYTLVETEEKDERGDPIMKRVPKTVPILRYYTVFNVSDCILPEKFLKTLEKRNPKKAGKKKSKKAVCEDIILGYTDCPIIKHGQDGAFYSPPLDFIGMPNLEDFQTSEDYYSTLFHEAGHSTGHDSRLGRFTQNCDDHIFRSESYSKEELVAEMISAFLCGEAGISPKVIGNQSAYIGSWLKRLKDDRKLIVIAGAQAQKGADYILGRLKPTQDSEGVE